MKKQIFATLGLTVLMLLMTLSAHADYYAYVTKEAKKSSEYGYTVTLKTVGSSYDTGHAWVEFRNIRKPSQNTSLGYYPAKGKRYVYSETGRIIEEFNGHSDAIRVNVTKRQFNNALNMANYFKSSCIVKNSRGKCTVWKTNRSYSLTPWNKFVCTSYANRILRAAGVPVPSYNFITARLFLKGVAKKIQ